MQTAIIIIILIREEDAIKALRYSRQKESIKACLMNRHDHPTVDTLYANTREEFSNISLGTIYHNLSLLAETGEVRKLTCGDGIVYFDGDTCQHYHLICSECNQVYDIELDAMKDLNKETQEHAPGITDNYHILLYGRYSSCLRKKVNKAIDKPTQVIYIDISNSYYY